MPAAQDDGHDAACQQAADRLAETCLVGVQVARHLQVAEVRRPFEEGNERGRVAGVGRQLVERLADCRRSLGRAGAAAVSDHALVGREADERHACVGREGRVAEPVTEARVVAHGRFQTVSPPMMVRTALAGRNA